MSSRELRAGLGAGRVPFVVFGIVGACFLVLPVLVILPTSWSSGQFIEFPPKGFSVQWYEQVFEDPKWTDAILTSLKVAIQASLLATVMGIAAALGMRRVADRRGGRWARSLFIMPLAIPYVAYALGISSVFESIAFGALETTMPLVLGQSLIAFPLVYVVVLGAISGIDPRLGRAAATLGARWPMIVWKVELPLLRPAIVGGWLFGFVLCFDEAVLALFLAPVDQVTLAQELYRSAAESAQPTLSAVSMLITVAAIFVMGVATLLVARASVRSRAAAAAIPTQEASA